MLIIISNLIRLFKSQLIQYKNETSKFSKKFKTLNCLNLPLKWEMGTHRCTRVVTDVHPVTTDCD